MHCFVCKSITVISIYIGNVPEIRVADSPPFYIGIQANQLLKDIQVKALKTLFLPKFAKKESLPDLE